MSSNNSLTPKQRRAVSALIASTTQKQAAASAGISEKTLYRWLAAPVFQAALAEAEAETINQAIRHLVRMQAPAAAVIAMTLKNNDISPGIRLRAAISVFDLLIRLKSFSQLEERISILEDRLNE